MPYIEAKGASLKKSRELEHEKNLHHLTIHGHADSTPESPRWIVGHHHSEDDNEPEEHVFDDGHSMLAHVANYSGVPEEKE